MEAPFPIQPILAEEKLHFQAPKAKNPGDHGSYLSSLTGRRFDAEKGKLRR